LPTERYFETKRFVPTCALAVRASVFETVGGFNPSLRSGGDKEFGHRCFEHPAVTTAFTDAITVDHPARMSFGGQYSKALRIGHGLAQLAELGVGDDTDSWVPVPDYLLPPDPRDLRARSDRVDQGGFVALYAADAVISYLQVYGAGKYVLAELAGRARPPDTHDTIEDRPEVVNT